MSHKQGLSYKVCVYEDSYSNKVSVIGTYRTRDKAEKVLSDYLRSHDSISRAYIEKCQSFRNDKRNMWEF